MKRALFDPAESTWQQTLHLVKTPVLQQHRCDPNHNIAIGNFETRGIYYYPFLLLTSRTTDRVAVRKS